MNRLTILIEELCPEGVTHRALSDLFVQLNGMSGVKNKWAESGNCQFIDYLNVYKKMVVDVNDLPFATVTNFNQTTLKKETYCLLQLLKLRMSVLLLQR